MLLITGVWAFVWLTCFSYLTSKWTRTTQYHWNPHRATVEAPIAFCFFCTLLYVRDCCCITQRL